MSVDKVKKYLSQWGRQDDVLVLDESSATVELAARALGVEPERIAKTLAFKREKGAHVIVAAGDARIDNSAYKAYFGYKAKMLSPDETLGLTGYPVGGVCPFGIENGEVYLDISLKRFNTVFPACGSGNSAIELTCEELFEYSQARAWIDVCKSWREPV